jgi:hypothetical protein
MPVRIWVVISNLGGSSRPYLKALRGFIANGGVLAVCQGRSCDPQTSILD